MPRQTDNEPDYEQTIEDRVLWRSGGEDAVIERRQRTEEKRMDEPSGDTE